MLANLSLQLILAVAKQTEGHVVMYAEDGTISMEKEKTTQRSKCPNCSRVLQYRAWWEGTADICESPDTM